MLDLIPWLDETYIVEMGRLFFCGGVGDSTLMGRADVVLLPINYIGPCLQDLAFRLGGFFAARISPYLGLFVAYFSCRLYLKGRHHLSVGVRECLALSLLFSPLLFQSVLLTRIDSWALAFLFAAFAVLKGPCAEKSNGCLALGAFFAVLSAFVWPTAIVLAPIYPVFFFSWEGRSSFLRFCGWVLLFVLVLALPLFPHLQLYLNAFARHHAEVTSAPASLISVCMPLAREIARSPFVALGVFVGLFAWLRDRRYWAFVSLILVFSVLAYSSLYTFRIVYLIPFFFLLVVDGVEMFQSARMTRIFLGLMLAYGVLTGPIGHFLLEYPTLPAGLKDSLQREIGVGPKRVFAPDHATYYIGRELGWSQRGFARPSDLHDEALLAKALDGCDAAILRDFDPYTPFQQSCTPYGLFCKYVLSRAKAERDLPTGQQSWAARFGSQFSFEWHRPLRLNGFHEIAQHDMIHVYVRD